MDNHYFQLVTTLVFEHIFILALVISFLESVPVLGTFTPGTLFMIFFGFTASTNGVNIGYVILAGFIGAVLGDFIGYLMGKYAGQWMINHKKLLKQVHIETGRAFFSRHGGKSILIGRFVGVIRPIVPLIAGSIHMSMRKFLFWNMLGAFMWVTLYMVLGFFFGKHADLIEKISSRISIVLVLVLIPIVYVLYKKYKNAIVKI